MLSTPDAWLLWFSGVGIIGGGQMVLTNLPQIIAAMSAPTSLVPTLTTIFGVGNMLGRLTCMPKPEPVPR